MSSAGAANTLEKRTEKENSKKAIMMLDVCRFLSSLLDFRTSFSSFYLEAKSGRTSHGVAILETSDPYSA
jgi:hypothetical protein